MAGEKRVRFGIKTAPQHTTYDDMLRLWREADTIPSIEHAWVFDHFAPIFSDTSGPCLEGWTLLAAFAAATERLRVGVMVTGNTYRHPAVLANMAATIDRISHGRLDFGIGAGWNEMEHTMYGIPLYAPGERIRRMGEACEVYRLLCTEEVANFEGKYYQLHDARMEPKPVQKPYPPIVIGGGGEQLTLRMVAKYADIWNFVGGDIESLWHKQEVLAEHCRKIGRDPSEIEVSVQVSVQPDDLAATRQAAENYITAGATHVVLGFRAPYPENIVHRAAEAVAEPLLARYPVGVR